MTMIRKQLRAVTETELCDERYVIIRVANYLIVNVYMPCVGTADRQMISDDILSTISDYCERHSDCVPIIASDFNVNVYRHPRCSRISYPSVCIRIFVGSL